MKGYVQEELLEARRRTVLHMRPRVLKMAPASIVPVPFSQPVLSEEMHCERQPTGAALGYLFAVLAGAVGTGVMVYGPRVANVAWLWFGR